MCPDIEVGSLGTVQLVKEVLAGEFASVWSGGQSVALVAVTVGGAWCAFRHLQASLESLQNVFGDSILGVGVDLVGDVVQVCNGSC